MKLAYYRGLTMDHEGSKVFRPSKFKVGKQYLVHSQSAWLPRGDGGHYPETWVEVFDAETSKPLSKREATSAFCEDKFTQCNEEDHKNELIALEPGSPFRQCQYCFSKFQVVVKLKRLPEVSK